MVKIKNVFGDEYKGKQKNAVYQKRYGRQIRRLKEDKKENKAPGQREQQERFKVGLSWYSSLSYVEKEGLKQFLNERGINLTAQQYAIKIALDRGRVTKRVEQERILATTYKAGWDAEGWPYRQRITISNSNAYDLTDYQVKLTLSTDNVGQNFDWSRNGEDLRFFDEAGNKLSYYIESWDEVNKTATVWVKVPGIPASGGTYIYMYYGNENAVSESNGEAVFDFFDDFNGNSLDTSKWTVVQGSYSIADGLLSLQHADNRIRSVKTFSGNIVFDARFKHTYGGTDISVGLTKDDNMDYRIGFGMHNYGKDYYHEFKSFLYKNLGTSDSEFHTYEYKLYYDGSQTYGVYNREGTVDIATDSTDITSNTYRFSIIGGDTVVDWVRVRKYAGVEPSTTFGAEEYGLVKGYTTIQVEHILIEHAGIKDIYILDENEEEIIRFENLSNLEQGDIKTRWDWVNDTGKTVRYVIITSLSGTVNKVRL